MRWPRRDIVDHTVEAENPWGDLFARTRAPQDYVVSSWIPRGYATYAKILHPSIHFGALRSEVRWSDVARWSGVALTGQVGWADLVLPEVAPVAPPPWRGQGPWTGSLSEHDAEVVTEVLAAVTPPSTQFFFGLSTIWGLGTGPLEGSEVVEKVSGWPVLERPWRSYDMYRGPLAGAMSFTNAGGMFVTPSLWWPRDQSFFLSSEIDLPWTYVAGSRELITALRGESRLDVVEVSPDDPVGHDLPAWLDPRIEEWAHELRRDATTTIRVAIGDARLRLERQSARRASLATEVRPHAHPGRAGTSSVPVSFANAEELLGCCRDAVRGALRSLTTL